MKKSLKFLFLILFLIAAVLIAVIIKRTNEPVILNITGYISINGNELYVDEVEIITPDDAERIAELGLTPTSDMPNGYYIRRTENETQSYRLMDETFYIFVDVNLLFINDADGDRIYKTTNKDVFIRHLDTTYYDSPPARTVPFFIQTRGDKVINVTEKFEFTV